MGSGRRHRFVVVSLLVATAFSIWGISAPGSPTHAGQAEELVVAVFGGTFEQAWRNLVNRPFERQQNARIRVVTGLSVSILARMRAQRDNPEIDLAMFNVDNAIQAVNNGVLDNLDPQRIPNMNDVHEAARDPKNRFANFLIDNQVLTYNTRFVQQPPTSWDDLWRSEFKGKVSMSDMNSGAGPYIIAILSKVYGKGYFDSDAGFAKLKALRPSVLTFFTSPDQITQLLNQGDVWMAVWGSDRAAVSIRAGVPIGSIVPKEGALFWMISMGMAKGTKHKELAEKYVNFVLSEPVQKSLAAATFLSPTNRKVRLTGNLAKYLAYGDTFKSLATLDWDEFARVRDGWVDRWNREIQ